MQSRAKPRDQSQVRSIADCVPVGIHRGRELQADDRRDPGHEVDRQRTCVTALCACDPLGAHANPSRDLTKAQPNCATGIGQVIREAVADVSTTRRPDRREAFPLRHRPSIGSADYSLLNVGGRRCIA
jgi:hypothetical protein